MADFCEHDNKPSNSRNDGNISAERLSASEGSRYSTESVNFWRDLKSAISFLRSSDIGPLSLRLEGYRWQEVPSGCSMSGISSTSTEHRLDLPYVVLTRSSCVVKTKSAAVFCDHRTLDMN
jgi:hypothetical protein